MQSENMSSEKNNDNYEKLLFRYYAKKFPNDPNETVRDLMEIDIRQSIESGRSREEAISEILERTASIEQRIENYENRIDRLTILFAEGEIGEESYKRAIKTLENKLSQLKNEPKILKAREMREETISEKPTALWFLVPFFFGIIGGIVSYVGVKDDDENMAATLLFFGIFMFFIDLLIVWVFYTWLLNLFRF